MIRHRSEYPIDVTDHIRIWDPRCCRDLFLEVNRCDYFRDQWLYGVNCTHHLIVGDEWDYEIPVERRVSPEFQRVSKTYWNPGHNAGRKPKRWQREQEVVFSA